MPLTYADARDNFRPGKVRFLFIGESRPAQGNFFYYENSNLYRYTKQAFEHVSGALFNCETFKEYGCWLYVVCDTPVNGLEDDERILQIQQGIPRMIVLLQQLLPEYVIFVKKGNFGRMVYPAVLNTGLVDGEKIFLLPFPACGQQGRYVRELTAILDVCYFEV